jgi:hypothetical protein
VNNILLVYSSPKSPEREDEYNSWYNDFHLRQILKLPGFVAITRYKLSRTQTEWYPPMVNTPQWPYGIHSYLAIYELDRSADPAALFSAVRQGEHLRQSVDPDCDPVEWGEQWFYEAYAGREYAFVLDPNPSPPRDLDKQPYSIWLVPTTPISDDLENEYHKWYGLQGVLRNDGFESIARYRLSRVQGTIDSRSPEHEGEWPYGHHTFLAIWEVTDVETAYNSRRRPRDLPPNPERMPPRRPWAANWPSLHKADEHIFYEPVTRRAVSPWLELR